MKKLFLMFFFSSSFTVYSLTYKSSLLSSLFLWVVWDKDPIYFSACEYSSFPVSLIEVTVLFLWYFWHLHWRWFDHKYVDLFMIFLFCFIGLCICFYAIPHWVDYYSFIIQYFQHWSFCPIFFWLFVVLHGVRDCFFLFL